MSISCSPGWRVVTLAGVVLDLVGDVGDQLRSLRQVDAPDGMVMQRSWDAREPRQRTWVDRRQLWEAPAEDGGHVACGSKVASAGCRLQATERMLAGYSRQSEHVGSKGWPTQLVGESGNVDVGLVELCHGLAADELFGCHVEAVGVALDRLEKPGRWVVETGTAGPSRTSTAAVGSPSGTTAAS